MSIDLTPLKKTDCEDVQSIFNEKQTIGLLGGFHMLESIKQQVKPHGVSGWIARENGESVGAFQIGGRPQSHLMKWGELAVLPKFRRQRIATTMYAACTMQGILEGRRLFEDTIVGDNDPQIHLLPSIGANKAGVLRHKTGSAKDIILYQYDLMEADFAMMLSRINNSCIIYLHNSEYQSDLWSKNLIVMSKHIPDTIKRMENFRNLVLKHPSVKIMEPEKIRGVNSKTAPEQVELLKVQDAAV